MFNDDVDDENINKKQKQTSDYNHKNNNNSTVSNMEYLLNNDDINELETKLHSINNGMLINSLEKSDQPSQQQKNVNHYEQPSLSNGGCITAGNYQHKKTPKPIKKVRRTTKILKPNQIKTNKQTLTNNRRRNGLRRSLSYDTMPKMKPNNLVICQPSLAMQRRIPVTANRIYRSNENQNTLLICLSFISFTSMLAMAIIAPFFPTESAKKGMRESINGLVFSVYAFVYMIFSPLISLLIPIFGTKLTLILGILIAGISNILFGLLDRISDLTTFTTFCFLVRAFEAIGGTAFSTATYTILMEEFRHNIGSAFSIVETAVGLGLSLGPAIGGFLYGFGGYSLPFYVLGALMLFNIPICLVLIRNSKNYNRIKSPLKAYFKLLSIAKVIVNIGAIVIGAQLLSYLDPTVEPHFRGIGLPQHYVSLVFLILSAAYTLSSPIIGWLCTKVSNKFRVIAFGLISLAIQFFLLGPAPILNIETTFTQTAIVMALIGISYSLAFIPTFEILIKLAVNNGFPDDVTTYSLVSGLWSAFYSLGEIIGPIFGGFLTENYSFKYSSTLMSVLALIMGVICTITGFYHKETNRHTEKRPRYGRTNQKCKQMKSTVPLASNVNRLNQYPGCETIPLL